MTNETPRTGADNIPEKKKELLNQYIESALVVITDLEEKLTKSPNNRFSGMLGRIKPQLVDPSEFKDSTEHSIKHYIGNITNTYTALNFIAEQLEYESQSLSTCKNTFNELKPD